MGEILRGFEIILLERGGGRGKILLRPQRSHSFQVPAPRSLGLEAGVDLDDLEGTGGTQPYNNDLQGPGSPSLSPSHVVFKEGNCTAMPFSP
jgi:hypothetical protein